MVLEDPGREVLLEQVKAHVTAELASRQRKRA
jgi:hypothetical protein